MKYGLEFLQNLSKKELINMKHIAILIPTIKSGGAEKQASLLAEVLSNKYEVHFISFYGLNNASVYNKDRLENSSAILHFLEGSIFSKIIELRKILIENHIDTVFNYLTFCDVIGAFIEKTSGVKHIYNGIRNSKLPKIKCIAEKLSHNYIATATIYNCYSGAETFFEKGFNGNKNIVIPNCFSPISDFISRIDCTIKTIITVGRFVEQKDYLTALKVITELNKVRNDFKFIIVGYGELESQIRKWVKEFHIANVVDIRINPNNIPELLRDADIYLSTSLFEGTSNSIMEAMNYSLPVVATNVGDNSYLIEQDKSGFLTSIGDVEGITQFVSSLLDNHIMRVEFGKYANVKLRNEYTKEIFVSNYVKLLQ